MTQQKIELYKHMFVEKEKPLLTGGTLSASLFRYSTGVEAVRISNQNGWIAMLPFKGQQIWRAEFLGHPLTMKTMFDEPQESNAFLDTYGGFLLHCGLTALGNPSPEDTHPSHGELPNAPYSEAFLYAGEDQGGRYIALSGKYYYRVGFTGGYVFEPECRLYEDASTIHMTVNIENLRGYDLEYFYLCHINFRPQDGARLVDTAGKKAEDVTVHKAVPDGLPASHKERLTAYLDRLTQNPSLMDTVDSTAQIYDPEIVFTLRYTPDKDGNAHTLQVLPDGYGCYVKHNPEELPFGLRWISRTNNEDAMGMVLPATTEHHGYIDSKKKGYDRHIPPYGKVRFAFEAGILNPEDTLKTEEAISRLPR